MGFREIIDLVLVKVIDFIGKINFKNVVVSVVENKYIFIGLILIAVIYYLYKSYRYEKNYNYGEAEVERILGALGSRYKLINDVMIRTKNSTSQIDHLVVSKKGIYVIETKALNGVLYGNDYSRNWTQVRRGEKISIHNPIKQNDGHIRALEYLFKSKNLEGAENIEYIGVLAFADFTKLNLDIENYPIVRFSSLLRFIKKYRRKNLSNKEVREITKLIRDNNINSSKEREKHVQRIEGRKKEYEKAISKKICPVCSGKLKKKRIKRKKYLVCSKCSFKDLI